MDSPIEDLSRQTEEKFVSQAKRQKRVAVDFLFMMAKVELRRGVEKREDELKDFLWKVGDVVGVGGNDGVVCGVFWANSGDVFSSSHGCRGENGERIEDVYFSAGGQLV